MKIKITDKTTIECDVSQVRLNNSELFTLIKKNLECGESSYISEGYTLDDDTIHHMKWYGDKGDKELLKLIKIRFDKTKEQLEPIRNEWEENK